MSFQAGDCFAGIQGLLMGRTVANNLMLEELRKAVLELTEEYKHPLLENTGPLTNFIAFQNNYAPNYFLDPGDANLDISKVNSFFIYNNPYVAPSGTNSQTNAGYDLIFRSINDIEVLINVPGLPQFWTRNNNTLYFGSMPDNTYNCYMRYQKQHPLTNVVNGFVSGTPIEMADTWQEILEYAAAIRIAPKVNLANKKTELHTSLYGDQKFQTSGGIEGAPGLIFQRTSQRNRDQGTTTRRFRLRMSSV
jgi:hypothetical protein